MLRPTLAIIVVTLLNALYWGGFALGLTSGESVLFWWTHVIIAVLIVWWIRTDAKGTHYWPGFHYGLALLVLWPIAIPHYFFRTGGWRGVLRSLPFFVAMSSLIWSWSVGLLIGVVLGL